MKLEQRNLIQSFKQLNNIERRKLHKEHTLFERPTEHLFELSNTLSDSVNNQNNEKTK